MAIHCRCERAVTQSQGLPCVRAPAREVGGVAATVEQVAWQPFVCKRDFRLISVAVASARPVTRAKRPPGPEHNRAHECDGRALEGDAAPSPRTGDGSKN